MVEVWQPAVKSARIRNRIGMMLMRFFIRFH
jgi:hypothetical protein